MPLEEEARQRNTVLDEHAKGTSWLNINEITAEAGEGAKPLLYGVAMPLYRQT